MIERIEIWNLKTDIKETTQTDKCLIEWKLDGLIFSPFDRYIFSKSHKSVAALQFSKLMR